MTIAKRANSAQASIDTIAEKAAIAICFSERTRRLAGLLDAISVAPEPNPSPAIGVEGFSVSLDWSDPMALMQLGGWAAEAANPTPVDEMFDQMRAHLARGAAEDAMRTAERAIDGAAGPLDDRAITRFRLLRGLLRSRLPDARSASAYADLALAADAAWAEFDRLNSEQGSVHEVDAAELDYLIAELSAARAALLEGDPATAREHADCAAEHHPGVARAHYLGAKARLRLGERDEALVQLRRMIAADEDYAAMIVSDPEFASLDAEICGILVEIGKDAAAMMQRLERARKSVLSALEGGPPPPPALSRPAPEFPTDMSAPRRMRFVRRFASHLWKFMADLEIELMERTPALTARLEARRGARSVSSRRLAKRAIVLALFSVFVGGMLGRATASAFIWLEPEMFPGAAHIGFVLAIGAALAISHRLWARMRQGMIDDAPISRDREWALQARMRLNKAFDELNGTLKAPRNAEYFPDTTAMFRHCLRGPTHIDRAEGRVS